jgi:tetratricopeptide (TPR) repeat protein
MSVIEVAPGSTMLTKGRRWKLLLAGLVAFGLILGTWVWWTDRRYKHDMEEIEAEVLARRYAIACRKLDKLLAWKADTSGGLAYLLGSCELARGHTQAAAEAWERVPAGREFSEKAIRGRMRLYLDAGRLAAAERVVADAANDPRYDRMAILVLLVPTYREQGRLEEAERLVEAHWDHLNARGEGALEAAIKLVRLHVELSEKPISVDTVKAVLDHAAKLAPDDDRVWLGRANLAIRTGAFGEGERWLDACQKSRPDDVATWRARLDWAMATNRVDVVTEAIKHIPEAESRPAELHRWNAWLARRRPDRRAERLELESLTAAVPSAVAALERLAELDKEDRQTARAALLLHKKAEVGRLRARYLQLHDRKQPIRDAAELARLAGQLGRSFEARGFQTIAESSDQ